MAPLAGRLYVGTSGFAYPAWAPKFYPRGLGGRSLLAAYATRLSGVELNNTFYRRPGPSVISSWLGATPADFRFCPRAQRGAAHRALGEADPGVTLGWLAESLGAFGSRLGCVLLSVPRTTERDDVALERLLRAWPPSLPLALELAHPSWQDDAVHLLLREHSAALVATDRDEEPEPDLRRSGPRLYLRLRRSSYSEAALASWAARLEPFLAVGLDAFVFFRHDEDGTSALRAESLATSLAGFRPEPAGSGRPRGRSMGDTTDLTLRAVPRRHPMAKKPAPSAARDTIVTDLQATLVELIDLSLVAKQAHWNVVGPNFRSVHLELDEIVDTARLSADRVAERVATLGAVPDGRSAAVAKGSGLKAFPLGQVKTTEVVERVTTMIDTIAGRVRERIARSADPDPVTQDILIEAGDQLEKHAWMLRAQQA